MGILTDYSNFIKPSQPSVGNCLNIRAVAPGKLFWSGEHTVVYHSQAILMAVDPGVVCDLNWVDQPGYWLEADGQSYYLNQQQLQELVGQLNAKYRDFLSGDRAITDLLDNSYQLVAYHVAQMLTRWPELRKAAGVKICWFWQLKPGCGMGGSASLLWSVTRALAGIAGSWDWRRYYNCLMDSENLQHGYTSGLDITAQAQGGIHIYRADGSDSNDWSAQPISLDYPFYLVYTGTPISGTGECVVWAAEQFKQRPELLSRGKRIVDLVVDAVLCGVYGDFLTALDLNQDWLEELGVVPNRLRSFRQAVKQRGGVFKLTGAGAVRGEQGGVGLLLGDGDWKKLVDEFGYSLLPVNLNRTGVKLVSN